MKNIIPSFALFIVIVMQLGGCANVKPIAPAMIASADYGEYPSNYIQIGKEYFGERLKDPYSAQYRFSEPYKAYLRSAPISGGEPISFGYVVEVYVNAKNSYGGYAGEKLYKLYIRNRVVEQEITSNQFFNERWYR